MQPDFDELGEIDFAEEDDDVAAHDSALAEKRGAMTVDEMIVGLVDIDRGLHALWIEHLADYEVALPHVFFGDVARWMIVTLPFAPDRVQRAMTFLGAAYAEGDLHVRNVVDVSLLENLLEEPSLLAVLEPPLSESPVLG